MDTTTLDKANELNRKIREFQRVLIVLNGHQLKVSRRYRLNHA